MSRDFDAEEATRRTSNEVIAPTTVALADTLFDLAIMQKSTPLQDLAIGVSAKAQEGIEFKIQDVARTCAQANRILGLATTCKEPISENSVCSLLNVPGTERCPLHFREEQ